MEICLVINDANALPLPLPTILDNDWMSSDDETDDSLSSYDESTRTKVLKICYYEMRLKVAEKNEQNNRMFEKVKKAVGIDNLIQELNLKVSVPRKEKNGKIFIKTRSFTIEEWNKGDSAECLNGPGKKILLERLFAVFGRENVECNLTLDFSHLVSKQAAIDRNNLVVVTTNELKLLPPTGRSVHMSADFPITPQIRQLWRQNSGFLHCVMNFGVKLNETAMRMVKLMIDGRNNVELERKLVTDGICTDLKIVFRDGQHLNCHRAFLAGRSDVFRAMFENQGTKESMEGVLVLDKMGEASVKAMVGWIYVQEIGKEAEEDSDVLLELIEAGHKYEMKGLQDEATWILMRKTEKEKWLTIDSAVRFFLFARNVDELNEVRDRAARILKQYAIETGNELEESGEYQNMFETIPKAAMELTRLFLRLA